MKIALKIIMSLFVLTNYLSAKTIYTNGNEINGVKTESLTYEAKYIKYMQDTYLPKIPMYINDYTKLIGLFAPNGETLTLEYMLIEEEILDQYKKSVPEDTNPYTSIYSDKFRKYFKNNLANYNKVKCYDKFFGKFVFDSNMSVIFNYYMGTEFYTSFILNKNTCKILFNR